MTDSWQSHRQHNGTSAKITFLVLPTASGEILPSILLPQHHKNQSAEVVTPSGVLGHLAETEALHSPLSGLCGRGRLGAPQGCWRLAHMKDGTLKTTELTANSPGQNEEQTLHIPEYPHRTFNPKRQTG